MHAFLNSNGKTNHSETVKSSFGDSKESKPWVEKYRPRSVDEVAHQNEIINVLRKSLTGTNLPNLLFYGPPGTGKTSTILALSLQLYGAELMKDKVLELNASDERGIGVIREKVKHFAQATTSNLRSDGKKCPPYKIIILDEADSMTKAAQEALRRTMEKQTKTTRFCLICNYVSRIIAPITSRCSQFRFKPLSFEDQKKRLLMIVEKENVKISDEALDSLIQCSEGDLRKSVTYLQTAYSLKKDDISKKDVLEITGVVPDDIIVSLFEAVLSNNHEKIQCLVNNAIAEGHAAANILRQLFSEVIEMPSLNDQQKTVIIEKMAVVDKCLNDGASEYLQLIGLTSTMQQQMVK